MLGALIFEWGKMEGGLQRRKVDWGVCCGGLLCVNVEKKQFMLCARIARKSENLNPSINLRRMKKKERNKELTTDKNETGDKTL